MASVLVTIAVTFVFLVAQLMADPAAVVGKTGMWLLIVFAAALLLLVAAILYANGSMTAVKGDIPMVLGIGMPGLATILAQWLFVRWLVKRGLSEGRTG